MEQFKNYLKINIDSKSTRKNYISRLKRFFSFYSSFNQEYVNAFLADCIENGLSPDTFNGYLHAFKQYAKMVKINIDFPKQKQRIKTIKKYITLKELEKEILPYFDMIFEKHIELRKLLIRLMFTTGLRPCEVLNLEKDDLNFNDNHILVKGGKDKEDRITFLVSSLHSDLKKQCEKSNTNKVFNFKNHFIQATFNAINTELGYKKHLNPYMCRHSFAHRCIKQGIDATKLQKLMGHSNIQTTLEYLQYEPEEIIKDEIKKFKFKKG